MYGVYIGDCDFIAVFVNRAMYYTLISAFGDIMLALYTVQTVLLDRISSYWHNASLMEV